MKRTTSVQLLAILVGVACVAGCGGDAGINVAIATPKVTVAQVHGTVEMPNGQVATGPSSPLQRFANVLLPEADALTGNVSPVGAGNAVTLVLYDAHGNQNASSGSTPTNAQGFYSMELPAQTGPDTCRYVVQVGSGLSLTRAFVTTTSDAENIDFASEAAVRMVLDNVRAGDNLCNYSSSELDSLTNSIRTIPGTVSGANAAEVNEDAYVMAKNFKPPLLAPFMTPTSRPTTPGTATAIPTFPPPTLTFTPSLTPTTAPVVSQLTSTISATATQIPVADICVFPASGTVKIDTELISYSGTTPSQAQCAARAAGDPIAGTLDNAVRGADATSHLAGAVVELVPTPPTATATAPSTFTPTNAVVLTPTPTPTAVLCNAPAIQADIVSATPGTQVTITATLRNGGAAVAGTQNDLTWDPLTPVNVKANGKPDCTVNPDIDKTATSFGFRPAGCTGTLCTAVRALVLSTDNVDPIPDGVVLYTCKVNVAATADSTYPIVVSSLVLSDPVGGKVPDASGCDGAIIAGNVPPPTQTPTVTPTSPQVDTPTPTLSPTNTDTPTITPLPTNTDTPCASCDTPTITLTPVNTATPTLTFTPVNTATPTLTLPINTSTPTLTLPINTSTPTLTLPINTATPTLTLPINTATPTLTLPINTSTPTLTLPINTSTPTLTLPVNTSTPTLTLPIDTATPTLTLPVSTATPTITSAEFTPTPANTPTTGTGGATPTFIPRVCKLGGNTGAVLSAQLVVLSLPLSGQQTWRFGPVDADSTRKIAILPTESHFDCAGTVFSGMSVKICARVDPTAYCHGGPNDGKVCPPADCGAGNSCAFNPGQGTLDCAPSGGDIVGYDSLVQIDHDTNQALVQGKPNLGLPADPQCVGTFTAPDGSILQSCLEPAYTFSPTPGPGTPSPTPRNTTTPGTPTPIPTATARATAAVTCSGSQHNDPNVCNSPTVQTFTGVSTPGGFKLHEAIDLSFAIGASCTEMTCSCDTTAANTNGNSCTSSDQCGNGTCAVCPPETCPLQDGELQIAGDITSGLAKGIIWNVKNTSLIMGTTGAGNGAAFCNFTGADKTCITQINGAPIDLSGIGGNCLGTPDNMPELLTGATLGLAYPAIDFPTVGDFIATLTLQCTE